MLSLKLAPGTNPLVLLPPCSTCVCVCVPYTVPLEGLRVGVQREAQMAQRDSERKKRKVCAGEGTIGGRAVEGMGCH